MPPFNSRARLANRKASSISSPANAGSFCVAAINYGEPVVLRSPRAEMSTSLVGLANMLSGRDEAALAKAA